eukprot:UN23701
MHLFKDLSKVTYGILEEERPILKEEMKMIFEEVHFDFICDVYTKKYDSFKKSLKPGQKILQSFDAFWEQ